MMPYEKAVCQDAGSRSNRRHRLVIDLDRCWGCQACEVACKKEHGLPPGAAAIRVVRVGPRLVKGRLRTAYVPCLCLHCKDPVCLVVCPLEAIEKGPCGEVRIVRERCTGCGRCAEVCPYGAIELGSDNQAVTKCDLCADRLSLGLPPSCLQHCEGRALALLDEELFEQVRLRRYAWSTGIVAYISTELPALGLALQPAETTTHKKTSIVTGR